MIVVLGRLRAARSPIPDAHARFVPAGLAVEIARAGVAAGSHVEIIGVVGEDPAADDVARGLERAGIGHATVIHEPTGPTDGPDGEAGDTQHPGVADIARALADLPEIRAVVLVGQLETAFEEAALEAAGRRGILVVAAVPDGARVSARLAGTATVIEAPDEGAGPFARMLGRFAAELDHGAQPGPAFEAATAAVGWQSRAARGARP